MGVSFDCWLVFLGFLWLWPALLVNGREDAFQEDIQENNLPEAGSSPDDILDINQALIPLEAPESSFLTEGDIIKASPFRLFTSASPRWPKKGGIVQIPYVISHTYDKSSVKIIQEAFEDFAKFTCIKFIPYSYQRDFISIVPLSGCFSSVGRTGGMQVVSLAPACLRRGKGVALHEFMHVLGFWHEHCRADRDKYISISWNDILTGFEINFMKSWNTNMLVDYDYSSVMHYGRNAFSMTGLPTIIPLSSSHAFLGQRWNLSRSDVARVNKLYKCSQGTLQPETSTERILQEKMKDFIPHEPEPCSNASQVKLSTAQSHGSITEAREMAHPARETLQKPGDQTKVGITQLLNKPTGKSSDAIETQTTEIPWAATLTQDRHGQTLLPPGAASKMEYLTVAQEVPPETQATETEVQTVVKVAQESMLWQALENPASSPQELKTQASDLEKAYTASQQKTTEAMTRTVPQVKHTISFGTRSPASLLSEIVQGTATRPSEKALHWPLSSTRATHAEYVTETSTPTETRSLLVMRSSESEDVNGPLHSTEGYPFTLNEKQSEELGQQSISSSGKELGNFTDVPLREGAQAKATISVYATTPPRAPENPMAASRASGVEATISSEAGSQASFTTGIPHGMAEEEIGSFYKTKGSRSVYTQHSSTRRRLPANDFEQLHSTEEAQALGSSEVQEDHRFGQIGATAASASSRALITDHLAASRMKEATLSQSSSVVPSVEVEGSSLPPGSLTRKGSWEGTVTPSGSLFETEWVPATEMPMGSEKLTPLHAESAGQSPTQINLYSFAEPASLAMETNQAMFPTERASPLGAAWSQNPGQPEQRESLILQPSNTEKYGLSALLGRLATSTGVQAEGPRVKQTIDTALVTATESMSVEQKATVSHGEETGSKILVGTEEIEAHRRESMQGALSSESVRSPMLSYTQVGWVETPQPHTDFSLVNSITGAQNGDTQAGLRRATSPRQEMAASSSGAKSSSVELTTKGLSFLDRQFRLESTSQPSPATEVKEHGSTLEGIFLPMRETRTALSWVSGSRNPTKSTGFGSSAELLKETTSYAVSEQKHVMPYKRKIPESTMSKGTSGVSSISSNFFTTLVLGNQTSKYAEEPTNSPPLWETQTTDVSESSLPQFLSKLSSNPRELSPFIQEEHINLSNATKEMLLGVKGATANAQKHIAPKATVPAFLLDMQPTAIPHAAIGGTALPLTTDLLKSPKFVSYGGEPAAISPIKETLPPTVGITTAPVVYSVNAIPIQTWEIQASIPLETRDLTSRATKKGGEAGLGTYASTEIYGIPSASTLGLHEASTLGLHEGPTISTAGSKVIGIPQLPFDAETIRPTYKTVEERQAKPLLEKGSKSGIYVLGKKTTVVNLGLGSQTAAQNGGGIIATTTTSAKLSSQSGYTHSSPPLVEEPTIIHGKKEAINISAGPTRKLVLEMMGSPIPGDGGNTEMAPSVPDSQNNLASEKTKTTLHLEISSEGMYLTDMESTEGVTATTGVSLAHPQTVSPDEVRIQLKYHRPHVSQGLERENGYSELLPVKGTPTVISNEEILGPSTEELRQVSETRAAMRQEDMIQMRNVGLEHNKSSSVDNPASGHQLGEKSLLERK